MLQAARVRGEFKPQLVGVQGLEFPVEPFAAPLPAVLAVAQQGMPGGGELGAPMVVSKADKDLHARLLLKIGADEVVFPERDMAQRTAMRFSVNGALEYIELAPGYAIFELDVPDHWAGQTLIDLDIRKRWNVNVIGRKEDGAILPIDAGFRFLADTHILVAGRPDDVSNMMK